MNEERNGVSEGKFIWGKEQISGRNNEAMNEASNEWRKQRIKEFSQLWPDHLQEVWQGRQGQGHEDFLDFSEVLPGMKLVGAALKQKYLDPVESVHSTALLQMLLLSNLWRTGRRVWYLSRCEPPSPLIQDI